MARHESPIFRMAKGTKGTTRQEDDLSAVAGRVHTWLQSHGDAALDGRDDEPLLREVEAVLVTYRLST